MFVWTQRRPKKGRRRCLEVRKPPQKSSRNLCGFLHISPETNHPKISSPRFQESDKKRPLINEPNRNSSRLPEGLECIQKHAINRQKRTENMPNNSQKDAKMNQGLPKWRPRLYNNNTKTTQGVQKWILGIKPNLLMDFWTIWGAISVSCLSQN